MLDFLTISTRPGKRGSIEIYPKFIIKNSSDLMIRGRDFYAIWVEERGLWSSDEQDALALIDAELDKYAEANKDRFEGHVRVLHMWDAETGMIDAWHKYCQKQMRDSYHMLDEKLIFSNSETNKKDYASKRLPYPLEEGGCPAFNKLISTLYTKEEKHKIEWAIGSIVTGDSKSLQKFMVLYGAAGTGKSTILNIIQQLFEGYYSVFDARALGSASNAFALEAFKNNPLVAIQHDGDLSRIEDNTRINSLVSHEEMTINEKFKATYTNRFKCFLFMGTNKPVKITDAKSGLIRRLIDVTPSGKKLNQKEYKTIMKQIPFELGAIASHCRDIYLEDPTYYDDYIPTMMMGASNDFYNYVMDSFNVFAADDGTTLRAAWEMYKTYCDDAKVPYPLSQRSFKEELKNYFWDFYDVYNFDDGTKARNYYSKFRTDRFIRDSIDDKKKEEPKTKLIDFEFQKSIFDKHCANYPAQYATSKETPSRAWDDVTSTLSELDTSKLHYVKVPENHIVIDFDIKDRNGKKSFEKNLEEASKWPKTYAELSKSGGGIHLHYIYSGDVTKLSRIFDDDIEVKIFSGKSSLRRKLSKCNNLPIATINSGLPLKGETKMVNFDAINNEKALRTLIKRNLNKEYHSSTRCSIDFIHKILSDAYAGELKYDVTDLFDSVFAFAANSTNQAEYCMKLVDDMHFKSDEQSENVRSDNDILVFYDVEVFPNLFLVNWKVQGEGKPVVRMINPKPSEIEELIRFNLIGFNNRNYDNHILYGRLMGYTNEQLYDLSQRLISKDKQISRQAKFGEAYNLSYTDVYDFASAGNKKSLKKWEIELGIAHKELGLPWDQPVPENMWIKVAEYCDNDVIATEAVFNHLSADWTARQILADLAGLTYNDTTNTLTTRFVFGNNRNPQSQFNYRDLAKPVGYEQYGEYRKKFGDDYKFRVFDNEGQPTYQDYIPGTKLPDGYSILPFFPGYTFSYGKSMYRGEEVGEGGYVHAEPGIYILLALLDVASMHPHSALAEMLFGPKYTQIFRDIVYGRVYIKHEDWDLVSTILDGKLAKYVQKVLSGEMTSKDLANALKTAINSVYGLTFAAFANEFKDPRNKDNIVAKRGALFMLNLKHEVQKRGFTAAHIKTDSIKIPNATPEIIQFVMDYGKEFGYTFEHEATYDRMCLVNDAVYIARYANEDGTPGEWTATGTQFQVPYVFKKLFTHEPIKFEDLCETKSVTSALYLDMNERLPDVSMYEKERDKIRKNIDAADRVAELDELIAEGHDYNFVGRVGNFCPVKPGCGGGWLMREAKDTAGNIKYASAGGAKGYRWLEAEMVKTLGMEDDIDKSYFNRLADDAADAIAKYGDYSWFVSDESYPDIPPWETPKEYFNKVS